MARGRIALRLHAAGGGRRARLPLDWPDQVACIEGRRADRIEPSAREGGAYLPALEGDERRPSVPLAGDLGRDPGRPPLAGAAFCWRERRRHLAARRRRARVVSCRFLTAPGRRRHRCVSRRARPAEPSERRRHAAPAFRRDRRRERPAGAGGVARLLSLPPPPRRSISSRRCAATRAASVRYRAARRTGRWVARQHDVLENAPPGCLLAPADGCRCRRCRRARCVEHSSAALTLPEPTALSTIACATSWLFVGRSRRASAGRLRSLAVMPVGTKDGHSTERRSGR